MNKKIWYMLIGGLVLIAGAFIWFKIESNKTAETEETETEETETDNSTADNTEVITEPLRTVADNAELT